MIIPATQKVIDLAFDISKPVANRSEELCPGTEFLSRVY